MESLLFVKPPWHSFLWNPCTVCRLCHSCRAPQGWQEVQSSHFPSSVHLEEDWKSQTAHGCAPHHPAWLRGCDMRQQQLQSCAACREAGGISPQNPKPPRSRTDPCAIALGTLSSQQVWGSVCSPGLGRISCAPWLMMSLNPFWRIPGQY